MIKTIITGGQYDDPRDYQDDTPQCKNCGCNPKYDDMDVCSECIDEFDEMVFETKNGTCVACDTSLFTTFSTLYITS